MLLAPVQPRGIFGLSWSGLRTLAGVLFRWAFWRRPNRPSAARFRYGIYNCLAPDEQRALYPSFVEESGRATVEALLLGARVDASRVRCPVFVAGGAEDRATPPRIARAIAARYRGTYREYARTSHWMITEPAIEQIIADALVVASAA